MQLPSWICPCRRNRVEPFVVVSHPVVDQPPVNDAEAPVIPPEDNLENPYAIEENPYLPAAEAQDHIGPDENPVEDGTEEIQALPGTGEIQDHLGPEGNPVQDSTSDNQARIEIGETHPDHDETQGQMETRSPTPFDPVDQHANTSWPTRVASGISGTASRIVERIKGIARPSTPDSDSLSI